MMDDLHLLLGLQKFDAFIEDLKGQILAKENIIQTQKKDLDALKNNLTSAKTTLQHRQAKKKELELAADEREKLVKKHQGELNTLKSNDAYKAMLVEISSAKVEVTKIEDEILNVMESIEAAEKEFKAQEQKMKAQEGVIKGEIQKMEGEKSVLQQSEKTKEEERQVYAQTVPGKWRGVYESIRERRGALAVVPMIESNCSGCRMTLTPHQANEVRKRKNIVRCESCFCIVYLPVDPTPPAPTLPPADSLASTPS